MSVPQALDLLAGIPPVDELLVCHGDACAPNALLTGDGRCSGHVDLGSPGVADRWADLAVTPVIDRTYPLSEVAEAIRYIEQGHAKGKVVITV